MVIGPSGIQFFLLSYEWLTKSDDREAGVQFVNHKFYQFIITVTISEKNKYI